MEINVQWLKQKYQYFNQLIFNNSLPPCSFAVLPLPDNTLGKFGLSKSAQMKSICGIYYDEKSGRYIPLNKQTVPKLYKPKITISTKYSRSEKEFENTLIHEMCHYWTCFDEEDNFRYPNKENDHHGADFFEAARMVSTKTNGQVTIKQIEDGEIMDNMEASSTYNKDSVLICIFSFHGDEVFFMTKMDLMLEYKRIMNWDIKFANNPTLLMLLKRYGYKVTTDRTFMSKTLVNAYKIDGLPEIIKNKFNETKFNNIDLSNLFMLENKLHRIIKESINLILKKDE